MRTWPHPHRTPILSTSATHYVADTTDLERIGSLSALCSDFVRIRFDDFRRCSHFVEAEPRVVDEDLDALKHEALMAYGRGQDGVGDRCMHRWLIIRECHSLSGRRIREYFDKLALRKNTYNDFQRDFLAVTGRLKHHAPAYLRQHEPVPQPATRITDWNFRVAPQVNLVNYEKASMPMPIPSRRAEAREREMETSTPIPIPSRHAEMREREVEARERGRYMSFDGGRIVSPRELSPATSSNPYAEEKQQSQSHASPEQNLPYRPHPTQRRGNISSTSVPQISGSSAPVALHSITDEFVRNQQPAANESFRGGVNNPYRITQEIPQPRTHALPLTQPDGRLERAQMHEAVPRTFEYQEVPVNTRYRGNMDDPSRGTIRDRPSRYQQPEFNEASRGDMNATYRSSHPALPRTRTHSFAQPSTEGNLPRSIEGPTRPPQAPPTLRAESETHPPSNPTVVIRDQEATIEPSILPGATIDIQAEQTETNNAWYSVRRDGKNFFRAGRVFKIIWHTPAGTNRQGQFNQSNNIMDGPLNSKIHTKTMWMLVVFRKHGYSICCPISTYDGNGLSRKNLHQQEIRAHSVIYSSNTKPKIFHDEPKMGKQPIPVDMAKGQPDLDKASRVHFGKFHTVEWNVFVMNVGTVKKGYEEVVRNNFLRELLGSNPSSALTDQH